MEQLHREVLKRNLLVLCDEMEPIFVAQHLESKGLMRTNHVQEMESKPSTVERNRWLLSFIPTRGPKAFGTLLEILASDPGQEHLAELLKSQLPPTNTANTATTAAVVVPVKVNAASTMNPAHVDLLTELRFTLIRDMRPAPVVDYLISSRTFLEHHEEEIMRNQHNSDHQNRELLRILKTRDGNAFQQFIAALKATQQYDLATLLESRQ